MDLLYTEPRFPASHPVRYLFSQNMDFSTFPLLCREIYQDMKTIDSKIERSMPFCLFQHVATTTLNAVLLDTVRTENTGQHIIGNGGAYLKTSLPTPVLEYFTHITEAMIDEDTRVAFNLPKIAIPQNGDGEMIAGTFGPANATNHNVYECYASPYVTEQKIRAQIEGRRGLEWMPLPEGYFPVGATPTQNLIGYGPLENLNTHHQNALNGLDFPAVGDLTLAARIRYSVKATARVSNYLNSIRQRYEISNYTAYKKKRKLTKNVGFLEVLQPVPSNQLLSTYSSTIWSPYPFGGTLSVVFNLFGLKRKRNENAPGLCYLEDGSPPTGWIETINSNFTAHGAFNINYGCDDPALRVQRHTAEMPTSSRAVDLRDWLKRHFPCEGI